MSRLSDALAAADAAFWAAVAAAYPEATTGDLDPGTTLAFDATSERAVQTWVELNATSDRALCAALPVYNGWRAFYEYPGQIEYAHSDAEVRVVCTSDWERPETLDVQLQRLDGHDLDDGGDVLPWPRRDRTWGAMFALLRPFLDRLQPACAACGRKAKVTP